jgi:hypothetical protein
MKLSHHVNTAREEGTYVLATLGTGSSTISRQAVSTSPQETHPP